MTHRGRGRRRRKIRDSDGGSDRQEIYFQACAYGYGSELVIVVLVHPYEEVDVHLHGDHSVLERAVRKGGRHLHACETGGGWGFFSFSDLADDEFMIIHELNDDSIQMSKHAERSEPDPQRFVKLLPKGTYHTVAHSYDSHSQ